MTLKIMTLIDGSSYTASVCDHAAWVAGKVNAELKLVHFLERKTNTPIAENLSGSIGLGARTELLEELAELDGQNARLAQKRGRAILDDATARLQAAGFTAVSHQLRRGEVVEVTEGGPDDADLIVIGKRGEAAEQNQMRLGPNLERVVRSSHQPVLVASRAFKPIQSALLAYDGGNSIKLAIDYMIENPAFADIDCRLLAVNPSPETVASLENTATRLRQVGYSVATQIESGEVKNMIARSVEKDGHNLLIMGAFRHSRIRNLFISSTTTEVLRACRIPVLLFR
jgi:nucleotide-binding universal stress UspA family protein